VQAQEPARFQKAYGLDSSETASDVVQLPDGGFMLVGTTSSSISAGGSDIYVVRTDAQGELQWARSYGGAGNEVFGGIATTSDGGIVVAGSSASWASPDSIEPYLLKIDAAGDPVWSRTYGSMGGFNGVASTPDGGFILAGSDGAWPSDSSPDMLVIRADADGDTLWTRLFDTPSSPPPFGSWSFVRFVRATSDGGCIIGGGVASVFVGTGSPFLLKLTANGTLSWSNYYAFLQVHDLRITADGDLLVLGTETDLMWYYTSLQRITATGIPLGERTYFPHTIGRSGMHVFDDNSIAICGDNNILRTDATGDVLWAKERTPGSNYFGMVDMLVATDGDLVFTGWVADTMDLNYDALLIKVEDDVDGCGMEPLAASSVSSSSSASTPLPLPLGLWTGQVEQVVTQVGSGGTTTDICIGTGVPARAPIPGLTLVVNGNTLQVSNAQVGDRYALFDGMGRTVREGRVAAEQFMLPMAGLTPGAYTITLFSSEGTLTRRFAKH
jgi:hypothetical protein